MSGIYRSLLTIHIIIGALSLVVFWIPIAVRKGGAWHVRAGRWYANAMYLVAGSAIVICVMLLLDPAGVKYPDATLSVEEELAFASRSRNFALFLLAISILVITSVRHGILTLRAKRDHRLMRAPTHIALNLVLMFMGITLLYVGASAGQILFYIFAGICLGGSVGNLRYSLQKNVKPMEWMIAHLGAMAGAGIGSYTAFFVFGGNRFFSPLLQGNWTMIPWVLPAVVGTLLITIVTRRYRRKFSIKKTLLSENQGTTTA